MRYLVPTDLFSRIADSLFNKLTYLLAKVQRNPGLDFVTKHHKSPRELQPVYSLGVSDMLTSLLSLWRTYVMAR